MRATKKQLREMKVKKGIIYTLGELDCSCGKHFVIRCNEKHTIHWLE